MERGRGRERENGRERELVRREGEREGRAPRTLRSRGENDVLQEANTHLLRGTEAARR